MCGRDIEKSICREMSGNLESGMVAVGMFTGLDQTDVTFQKHVKALITYQSYTSKHVILKRVF